MAAAIKAAKGIDATLTQGHKGVFDVIADGKVIYSKRNTGRFPEDDEVLRQL